MDARELRYFAEVINLGSLTKASKSLNISQPALSKCLRGLEDKLGCTLIERGRFGVRPTSFGDLLYVRAKVVVAEIHLAQQEIQQAAGGRNAPLSIGILPSLATGPITDSIMQLLSERPKLRFQIIERPRVDLIPSLRRGEFEIAIGTHDPTSNEAGLAQKVLYYDRPVLAVRMDHPALNSRGVAIKDLLTFPWILPRPGAHHRVHVEKFLGAGGYSLPEEFIESQSIAFTRTAVTTSDCIGILANDSGDDNGTGDQLVKIDLGSDIPDRAIGIIHRSDRPLPITARQLTKKIAESGGVSQIAGYSRVSSDGQDNRVRLIL